MPTHYPHTPHTRHTPQTLEAVVLTDFIQQRFERTASESHARQLYRILRHGILDGSLPAGLRLPPSRQLATGLKIARNTVVHVYEHLTAEGYLRAGVGKGTFVSDTTPSRVVTRQTPQPGQLSQRGVELSRRGGEICFRAGHSRKQWGAFVPGVPDVTQFPHEIWGRLERALWRRPRPELLTYSVGPGYGPLREVLAQYLRVSRGVHCQPEQVFITNGTHQSLHLVAHLLGDVGDTAWFEEPGYWGARSVLSASGIVCRPIAVDDEGMNPQQTHLQPAPRFIFVSPSHQFPLGVVMSLARRRQLLEFARATGAWVIEDDYDSEFRYGGAPLSSLQGLDNHGHVLYLGTLSKTLFPGLRVGYMVVPQALVESFNVGLAELYREGQLATQSVLATFIENGHFATHVRKVRSLYGERRAALIDVIGRAFGTQLEVIGSDAGLHLVLALPGQVDDRLVVTRALERDVATRPLSLYYMDAAQARKGLLLGYACVPEEEIERNFSVLESIIGRALQDAQ